MPQHDLEGVYAHVTCCLHVIAPNQGLRHRTNHTGRSHPAEYNQHRGEHNPRGNGLLNLLTDLTVDENRQNQQRGNHNHGFQEEEHNPVDPATKVRHHATVDRGDNDGGDTHDQADFH